MALLAYPPYLAAYVGLIVYGFSLLLGYATQPNPTQPTIIKSPPIKIKLINYLKAVLQVKSFVLKTFSLQPINLTGYEPFLRNVAIKLSMSPFRTASTFPVSKSVLWSLTILYG